MRREQFRDRTDAGRRLADQVAGALSSPDAPHLQAGDPAPVVLGLPRGGVPVAAAVADRVGGVLDVFVARKIGAPHQPEFGIGAVAEGGTVVWDESSVAMLRLRSSDRESLAASAAAELARRVRAYRGERLIPDLRGRPAVLVDDGLATGVTAEAALVALRGHEPGRLLLAVPVAATDSAQRLAAVADDVVCVWTRDDFVAVGAWYERFDQTADDEVLDLLGGGSSGFRGREPG